MSETFKIGILFYVVNNTGSVIIEIEEQLSRLQQKSKQVSEAWSEVFNLRKAGIVTAGAELLKLGANLEQTRMNFEVLLGSKHQGDAMVQAINSLANAIPYMNQQLLESAKTMLSLGVVQDKVLPYMRMLGDVAMGDATRFESLTLAFSQTMRAGRLMGQDLLQMINAGFNPLGIISEKTGKSIGALKKEMEAGKLSSEMVADAFRSATSEGGKFYQMSERMSQTAAGKWSIAMGKLQGSTAQAMERMMPAVGGMVDVFIKGIDAVSRFSEKHKELTSAVLGAAVSMAGLYAGYKVYKEVQESVLWVRTAILSASAAQKGFNLSVLANPYVAAGVALAGLTYGIYKYIDGVKMATDKAYAFNDVNKEAFSRAKDRYVNYTFLLNSLKDATITEERRIEIAAELNREYKDLVGHVEVAKLGEQEINALRDRGVEKIMQQARAEVLRERIKSEMADVVEAQMELQELAISEGFDYNKFLEYAQKYGANAAIQSFGKKGWASTKGDFGFLDNLTAIKNVNEINQSQTMIASYEQILRDNEKSSNKTTINQGNIIVHGNADKKAVSDIQASQQKQMNNFLNYYFNVKH